MLIRSTAFTNGNGYYRILAKDKFGKTFHDRTVAMPNASSANLTDLPTI